MYIISSLSHWLIFLVTHAQIFSVHYCVTGSCHGVFMSLSTYFLYISDLCNFLKTGVTTQLRFQINFGCSQSWSLYHLLVPQINKYNNNNNNIGIMEVQGFLPKNPTYKAAKYLLCDSMAALVRHSQIQKYLQINSKHFALIFY